LLGCDGLSLQVMDSVHRKRPYVSAVEEGEHFVFTREELEASEHEPGVDVFWECWWTSPCSLPERTGRPVVVSLRSVSSQRQWAAHPLHTTYLPCADELVRAYVTGPGQSVRLLIPREGGAPFGERERTLLELLLPHLRDLLVAASARSQPAAAATLTGRQRGIHRFAARGLTNREIGRALGHPGGDGAQAPRAQLPAARHAEPHRRRGRRVRRRRHRGLTPRCRRHLF